MLREKIKDLFLITLIVLLFVFIICAIYIRRSHCANYVDDTGLADCKLNKPYTIYQTYAEGRYQIDGKNCKTVNKEIEEGQPVLKHSQQLVNQETSHKAQYNKLYKLALKRFTIMVWDEVLKKEILTQEEKDAIQSYKDGIVNN